MHERPLLGPYLERRADLVRFFAARLHSKAAAEDLVQDMYERVLRVEESVGNPDAYLYRLGANLLLDRARRDKRRSARETVWSQTRGETLGAVPIVDEPTPDQAVIAREQLRALLDAVERLPLQARRAFRLHKLEGLTHAQTAAAMGISKSGVEKHVSTALSLLSAVRR